MRRKKWLIALIVCVSVVSALFDTTFYLHDVRLPSTTATLASTLSVFLLAMWVDADSKHHPQLGRPFDFGFLVLMFWLAYLPYYLWRTRGPAGLLIYAGFVGLWSMGLLVQLLIYRWFYL